MKNVLSIASGDFSVLQILCPADIDAPTNLVAQEVTENSAMLVWDRVRAEIDGYMLTYSSAEGTSPEIQVGAEATSHQLASLKPGVLYTFFIWAYKGSRSSRKSSTEAEMGKLFLSWPRAPDFGLTVFISSSQTLPWGNSFIGLSSPWPLDE